VKIRTGGVGRPNLPTRCSAANDSGGCLPSPGRLASAGLAASLLVVLSCAFVPPAFGPSADLVATPPSPTPSVLTTPSPTPVDLTALSGEWQGTEKLSVAGACQLLGGLGFVERPVTMDWVVNKEGEVRIQINDWQGVYPYTFTGTVRPDQSISLRLGTSASCNGVETPYHAQYEGVIMYPGPLPELMIHAYEEWCPGSCLFRRRFTIHQSATEP